MANPAKCTYNWQKQLMLQSGWRTTTIIPKLNANVNVFWVRIVREIGMHTNFHRKTNYHLVHYVLQCYSVHEIHLQTFILTNKHRKWNYYKGFQKRKPKTKHFHCFEFVFTMQGTCFASRFLHMQYIRRILSTFNCNASWNWTRLMQWQLATDNKFFVFYTI